MEDHTARGSGLAHIHYIVISGKTGGSRIHGSEAAEDRGGNVGQRNGKKDCIHNI